MNEASSASNAQTSRQFNLISAGLAFFIWGGWAWYINSKTAASGQTSPLISGLTQGTASLLFTLIMVRSVTSIYHRLQHGPVRLVLPSVLTVIATGSCLVTAHFLVGTANIPATVAPGLTVAFLFNLLTTNVLRMEERKRENETGRIPS